MEIKMYCNAVTASQLIINCSAWQDAEIQWKKIKKVTTSKCCQNEN